MKLFLWKKFFIVLKMFECILNMVMILGFFKFMKWLLSLVLSLVLILFVGLSGRGVLVLFSIMIFLGRILKFSLVFGVKLIIFLIVIIFLFLSFGMSLKSFGLIFFLGVVIWMILFLFCI